MPLNLENLRDVERSLGISYPPLIEESLGQFAQIVETAQFRDHFPKASLIFNMNDIAAARISLPETLLPFMCVEEPSGRDFYAFDISAISHWRVAVWCDHAIVMDWIDFTTFLKWIHEFLESKSSQ